MSLWLEYLEGYRLSEVWRTAKFMLTQPIYGEPKLNDFFSAMKRIRAHRTPPDLGYNPHLSNQEVIARERQAQLNFDPDVAEFLQNESRREEPQANHALLERLNGALGSKKLIKEMPDA